MANALHDFTTWVDTNGATAVVALRAATELFEALQPRAAAEGQSVAQFLSAIEHPRLLRQIMDGVGLAEIAGRASITPEAVMEALVKVAGIATLFAGAL